MLNQVLHNKTIICHYSEDAQLLRA